MDVSFPIVVWVGILQDTRWCSLVIDVISWILDPQNSSDVNIYVQKTVDDMKYLAILFKLNLQDPAFHTPTGFAQNTRLGESNNETH